MIKKIFSPKKLEKNLAFYAQTTASFCKSLIIALDFEKNANYFAENWRKLQKIVFITSTPGANPTILLLIYDKSLILTLLIKNYKFFRQKVVKIDKKW
jgi:hypothetical protein